MNEFPNSTIGGFLVGFSLHDMHKNSHKHESDFVYINCEKVDDFF